jgi:hypothetical protein
MNIDKESYIELENNDFNDFMTHEPFIKDLLKVFESNDVQLLRGSDYQYLLMINGRGYAPSITPGGALVYGVKQYLKYDKNAKKSNMEV